MDIKIYKPVNEEFFRQNVINLARNLLGKFFVKNDNGILLAGKIVETEAYHQSGDESSHSFRGKTIRNKVMFEPAGRLYVYFTYGMHYCMNIVAESGDIGAAVLIRAVEPVAGLEIMKKNRGGIEDIYNLASGPAKLCQAFGIDKSYNGYNLTGGHIYIGEGPDIPESEIAVTPRIGISKSVDLPWRFFIKNNKFVSRKK